MTKPEKPEKSTDLLFYNPDKAIAVPGNKCAYCGCSLIGSKRTKDHVIGRRFVPQGTLAGGPNLIVPACRACNDRKAQLEDDISLISMLPDTAGRFARDDARLRATVLRKSKGSVSAATRRLAANSYNSINVKIPMNGGLSLVYEGTAMPTIADDRLARLAYFHVQGIEYLRSFDVDRGHGAWLKPVEFEVIDYCIKDDWGNPSMLHFSNEIRSYNLTAHVAAADGYFRFIMRKKSAANLWTWALEWNARIRVIGVYGDDANRKQFSKSLPEINPDFSWGDRQNGGAFRYDTALADEDDILFDLADVPVPSEFAAPKWRRGATV